MKLRHVLWVAVLAVGLIAPATAQQQNADQVTVPLSDPSRPGTLHVALVMGEINVVGRDIKEVIVYLKGRGIGILITDHNVRETLGITDRASIIHAGEVLFEGAPEEILADPEVRRVYLGDRFS